MIAYTVACTFDDAAVGEAWVAWLRDGHLDEVCAAGALDARIVQLDGPAPRYEVRYHFADRAAFDAYEAGPAAGLRAEGLARFPPERGVAYARSVGEVVGEAGHTRIGEQAHRGIGEEIRKKVGDVAKELADDVASDTVEEVASDVVDAVSDAVETVAVVGA